jgi:phosphatidylserine/phosphatidylglycerophosphate/cardiolipin synthase-like enzyme
MHMRSDSSPDLSDRAGTRQRPTHERMPKGLSYAGKPSAADDIRFLSDTTWVDADGSRHSEQEIFDAMFDAIRGARRLILLDMFLYNDFEMQIEEPLRLLSRELTDALLEQKGRYPGINIVVITDPINTVYGALPSPYFEALEAAGIRVVATNIRALRDSNPTYSAVWRSLVKPFGKSRRDRLNNPFDPEGKISLRSYLEMFNCKANHRKVLVCDDGDTLSAIVSSANPHDASSANSNVAVRFKGPAARDLVVSENAVLALSGHDMLAVPKVPPSTHSANSVQVLTEGAIKNAILSIIDGASRDARIDIAAFYVSDRDVIAALKRARQRGVALRILLDPNKDAFGYDKHGIPNRPAAAELVRAGIDLRWYHTHGEQCHIKMLLAEDRQDGAQLMLGSANLTRRNLDDFNLETNVLVHDQPSSAAIRNAHEFFDALWHNSDNRRYTEPYETYRDESLVKKVLYRFMEASGFSEF